jgi:hypothetical protein
MENKIFFIFLADGCNQVLLGLTVFFANFAFLAGNDGFPMHRQEREDRKERVKGPPQKIWLHPFTTEKQKK